MYNRKKTEKYKRRKKIKKGLPSKEESMAKVVEK